MLNVTLDKQDYIQHLSTELKGRFAGGCFRARAVVSPLLRMVHAIVQYKLMSLLALIYLKDTSELESFSWKRAKCFEVLHESFLPFQPMFALSIVLHVLWLLCSFSLF